MRWYTTLAAMLDEHSIHYTIEVSELLLHGKNANFDYLFWKKPLKGGLRLLNFFAWPESAFRLLLPYMDNSMIPRTAEDFHSFRNIRRILPVFEKF